MGNYEFTVGLDRQHLFTTLDQYLNKAEAGRLLMLLKDKFPAADGYEVICVQWMKEGQEVTEADLVS